ncbi:uncharacterized protein CXQ87_005086 [Candidozyma duobushaemuli]|uniref:Cytochrome b5 heme-binding domain-containing protein n=1 Tax=Candidozyma duobushaemuli TaxID=1231522 RepID=A0A2V1A9S0_9ASCO|nr:uncharacterized protein CXQ87_005086 [[Candida] duobushaemulonis]PVH14810.1 hypothetical protein CXQ87_005086 [[Candida] duobushaemulonis]
MAAEALRSKCTLGGRTLSASEIRKHSSPQDLWMTIHGKVYDVTNFATEHPGGVEVLLDCGGVDASEAFDDVAHSDLAHEMLEPYFIGYAESSKESRPVVTEDPEKAGTRKVSKRQEMMKELRRQRTAVLVLTGVAFLCVLVVMVLQKIQWLTLVRAGKIFNDFKESGAFDTVLCRFGNVTLTKDAPVRAIEQFEAWNGRYWSEFSIPKFAAFVAFSGVLDISKVKQHTAKADFQIWYVSFGGHSSNQPSNILVFGSHLVKSKAQFELRIIHAKSYWFYDKKQPLQSQIHN